MIRLCVCVCGCVAVCCVWMSGCSRLLAHSQLRDVDVPAQNEARRMWRGQSHQGLPQVQGAIGTAISRCVHGAWHTHTQTDSHIHTTLTRHVA